MTDATKARAALADRLETFASSLRSSPWSSRDAVLVREAVEMLRSPIAALPQSAEEAVAVTANDDAFRAALTRRILEAWSVRFPNNAYAWPGAPHDFASAAAKVAVPAARAALAAPPSPALDPVTWRCFHCSEVFTDKDAAREHFGFITLLEPGCIDPMRGDEKALRRREIESERLFRTVCAERDKLFGELKQARALLASPVLGIQANP